VRGLAEHTADDNVRFHVALSLRDCVVREWALRTPAERVAVRDYCVRFCLQQAPRSGPPPLTRAARGGVWTKTTEGAWGGPGSMWLCATSC
jgi:hypothetical protein